MERRVGSIPLHNSVGFRDEIVQPRSTTIDGYVEPMLRFNGDTGDYDWSTSNVQFTPHRSHLREPSVNQYVGRMISTRPDDITRTIMGFHQPQYSVSLHQSDDPRLSDFNLVLKKSLGVSEFDNYVTRSLEIITVLWSKTTVETARRPVCAMYIKPHDLHERNSLEVSLIVIDWKTDPTVVWPLLGTMFARVEEYMIEHNHLALFCYTRNLKVGPGRMFIPHWVLYQIGFRGRTPTMGKARPFEPLRYEGDINTIVYEVDRLLDGSTLDDAVAHLEPRFRDQARGLQRRRYTHVFVALSDQGDADAILVVYEAPDVPDLRPIPSTRQSHATFFTRTDYSRQQEAIAELVSLLSRWEALIPADWYILTLTLYFTTDKPVTDACGYEAMDGPYKYTIGRQRDDDDEYKEAGDGKRQRIQGRIEPHWDTRQIMEKDQDYEQKLDPYLDADTAGLVQQYAQANFVVGPVVVLSELKDKQRKQWSENVYNWFGASDIASTAHVVLTNPITKQGVALLRAVELESSLVVSTYPIIGWEIDDPTIVQSLYGKLEQWASSRGYTDIRIARPKETDCRRPNQGGYVPLSQRFYDDMGFQRLPGEWAYILYLDGDGPTVKKQHTEGRIPRSLDVQFDTESDERKHVHEELTRHMHNDTATMVSSYSDQSYTVSIVRSPQDYDLLKRRIEAKMATPGLDDRTLQYLWSWRDLHQRPDSIWTVLWDRSDTPYPLVMIEGTEIASIPRLMVEGVSCDESMAPTVLSVLPGMLARLEHWAIYESGVDMGEMLFTAPSRVRVGYGHADDVDIPWTMWEQMGFHTTVEEVEVRLPLTRDYKEGHINKRQRVQGRIKHAMSRIPRSFDVRFDTDDNEQRMVHHALTRHVDPDSARLVQQYNRPGRIQPNPDPRITGDTDRVYQPFLRDHLDRDSASIVSGYMEEYRVELYKENDVSNITDPALQQAMRYRAPQENDRAVIALVSNETNSAVAWLICSGQWKPLNNNQPRFMSVTETMKLSNRDVSLATPLYSKLEQYAEGLGYDGLEVPAYVTSYTDLHDGYAGLPRDFFENMGFVVATSEVTGLPKRSWVLMFHPTEEFKEGEPSNKRMRIRGRIQPNPDPRIKGEGDRMYQSYYSNHLDRDSASLVSGYMEEYRVELYTGGQVLDETVTDPNIRVAMEKWPMPLRSTSAVLLVLISNQTNLMVASLQASDLVISNRTTYKERRYMHMGGRLILTNGDLSLLKRLFGRLEQYAEDRGYDGLQVPSYVHEYANGTESLSQQTELPNDYFESMGFVWNNANVTRRGYDNCWLLEFHPADNEEYKEGEPTNKRMRVQGRVAPAAPPPPTDPHPLIAALIEQSPDDTDTIAEWRDILNKPDTLCKTGFGLSFEQVLFAKDGKKQRKKLLAQLNPLAYDTESGTLQLTKTEVMNLNDGVLRSKADWTFQFSGVNKTEMHTTYTATWSSPIIPDFQAQLVITQETLDDPSKWNATAVFDPDSGVLDMTSVKFESNKVTLMYDDNDNDVHYSLEHVLPPTAIQVLNDHRHFDEALAQLASHKGVMQIDPYRELEDEHKADVLQVATSRLLSTPSQQHPMLEKPITLVDNGDTVPEVGGDRAAWLAKEGALNVEKLHGFENDEQKAAYIHKCDLKYAKHLQDNLEESDNARFVALDHKMDAIAKLLEEKPKEAFVLPPRSTNPDPHEGDATRELYNNAAVKDLPLHTKRKAEDDPKPRKKHHESDEVDPVSEAHAKSSLGDKEEEESEAED